MKNNIIDFYSFLFNGAGPEDNIQVFSRVNSWPSQCFKVSALPNLVKFVKTQDAIGANLYFRVTPISASAAAALKAGERGKADLATTLLFLWADVDLAEPNAKGHHKSDKLPTSVKEAMGILCAAGIPDPSVVVHSGGGLHLYWRLSNPLVINDEATLKQAQDLSRGFALSLIDVFKKEGYKLDNTSDLARILRVPGTHNRKPNCPVKEVKLLQLSSEKVYPVSLFEDLISSLLPETKAVPNDVPNNDSASEPVPATPDMVAPVLAPKFQRHYTKEQQHDVIETCGVIKGLIANMAEQTEPEWFATVQLLVNLGVSDEEIHHLSSQYLGYDAAECTAKIAAAKDKGYTFSCRKLREDFPDLCTCGIRCKSPFNRLLLEVATARKALSTAIASKEKLTDSALTPLVNAIAVLKAAGLEIEATKGSAQLQKLSGLGKKQLEKIINDSSANQTTEGLAVLPETIDGALTYDFKMPAGYEIDNADALVLSNRKAPITIAESVFVPESVRLEESKGMIANLVGVDCLDESSLVRGSAYVGDMPTKVNELINRGFRINIKARDYLPAWVQAVVANNPDIPKELAVNKLGWTSDGEFFLPSDVSNRKIVDPITLQDVTDKFTAKGKLEDFITLIKKVEVVPEVRAVLATALASPLVSRLPGCRPWILHLYGQSRSGKTAAAALANALFLPKKQGVIRFDSTLFAMETVLGQNRHLMTVINEAELFKAKFGQTVDESLRFMIYRLAEGQSYQAGTKSGSLRVSKEWECTIVTTGEHPLLGETGGSGSRTRCMELEVSNVIIPENIGPELYAFIESNYGTVGAAFIAAIKRITIPTLAIMLTREIEILRTQNIDARYVGYLALMSLAYRVFAVEVLHFSDEEIQSKVAEMVKMFLNRYDTDLDIPEWQRYRDKVRDYLQSHFLQIADYRGYFQEGRPGPNDYGRMVMPLNMLGWFQNEERTSICMYTHAFNAFCEKEIPTASKRFIRRELIKHGVIQPSVENVNSKKNERYDTSVRDKLNHSYGSATNVRVVILPNIIERAADAAETTSAD